MILFLEINYPDSDMQLLPLDTHTQEALKRGKSVKTYIMPAAQLPHIVPTLPPTYAITKVSLQFREEKHLYNCVSVLQWSGDMFKTRPKQLHNWSRGAVYREGLRLSFTVYWYKKTIFIKRKDAFMNDKHTNYYDAFDAKPQDLIIEHQILSPHL